MFLPQGNVIPYPMHLSKCAIALERAGDTDVALCEVTPPDERGYMNLGGCGIAYGRFMCKRPRR
jgi:acyl-CoA hydrolase